ncbi:MAG: hypothetical protein WDZ76_07225 [Pseudohongiellaceae bacterium]
MLKCILLLAITTAALSNSKLILAQDTDLGRVFDFEFRSGVHRLDLNADGIPDWLTIGYISSGTAHGQFDFSFLISRPDDFSPRQQELWTVVPYNESKNYFITLRNADCVLRSIQLVKLGSDQNDWKLVLMERTSVPGGGFTESPVEFRLLRLRRASTAGSPVFSYRQVTQLVSVGSYCNVNEAFESEWDQISGLFERSLE